MLEKARPADSFSATSSHLQPRILFRFIHELSSPAGCSCWVGGQEVVTETQEQRLRGAGVPSSPHPSRAPLLRPEREEIEMEVGGRKSFGGEMEIFCCTTCVYKKSVSCTLQKGEGRKEERDRKSYVVEGPRNCF